MEGLKPCPFCGEHVKIIEQHIYKSKDICYTISHKLESGKKRCVIDSTTSYETLEESISTWNTRV